MCVFICLGVAASMAVSIVSPEIVYYFVQTLTLFLCRLGGSLLDVGLFMVVLVIVACVWRKL